MSGWPRRILLVLGRSAVGLLVAAALVAALAAASGVHPQKALLSLWQGACGDAFARSESLLRSIPICLTGLSVAWAFRAGLFNIGAEGQLLCGAMAGAWIGALAPVPSALRLPVALILGALAGALLATIPALLKVRRGTPEVVTTLLLNFVAENLLRFLANGPLHDPNEQGARTVTIARTAFLPLLPGGRLHAGGFLVLAVLAVAALILTRTRFGFQMQVVGQNPQAAEASRISPRRIWFWVLLQSGAIAGLAGAIEVLGVHHYYQVGFSPGYGAEGIAVAILGACSPLGVLAAGLFWGGLANGAVEMEISCGLSRHMITALQAVIVLTIAVRRWPVIRPRWMRPAANAAA